MNTDGRRFVSIMAVVFLIFVAAIAVLFHLQSLSAKITMMVAPSQSTITINERHGRDGTNRVKPGSYLVRISMDGFSTVTQKVTVKKGDNKGLEIVLSPDSEATSNWYKTHPADEKIAEGASSHNNDKLAQQSLNNAPLIQLLPFVGGGLEFRVDYGNLPGSQASQPVVYITAPTQAGQQAGLDWIRSLGYDPSNYNIKFVTATVQPLD